MITKTLEASEWKKLNLKKAEYAHVTKETIFIVFMDKLQGVDVEYSVEIPNEFIDIRLAQTLSDPVRTYMFDRGMVQRLKEVHTLMHYPRNSVLESKLTEMGLVMDTVMAMTKKGSLSFSTIRSKETGHALTSADIAATK